ncbi:MAG: glycosyltransferase family 2 protein [Chitinophagaceae bacterium]|nr:glycosyltransferase family 2 protein [Chitinophagaceae bacterium]
MINTSPHIPDCAVIIPVYNPPAGWQKTVAKQYNHFVLLVPAQTVQLVVVNDGTSGENMKEAIAELQQHYPGLLFFTNEINMGKGNALRKAVEAVTARIYLLTDVDFPYSPESMQAVYYEINSMQTDIAAGSRNEVYYAAIGRGRRFISKLLRFGIRSLFGISIDDTQCGLKGFSQKAKPVFLSCVTNRYLYDLEFIVRAHKVKQVTIKAVPVELRAGIELQKMALRIVLQELKSFITILKIRYS